MLGLVLMQVLLLLTLNDTKNELSALQDDVASLDGSVAALSDDLEAVAADVTLSVSQSVEGAGASSIESPIQTAPAGYLPRFERGVADAAQGMRLGAIEGVDGYSNEATTIDPADGTRRVWMIWAHWCPYCQEELPHLNDWYPTVADGFDAELVTVTTSIDESRGNPLPDYLTANQFPFPVIVDGDSQMAAKMGVSAFPFWIITDGDGEVLLRTAGLLSTEQLSGLFEQLDALDS